MANHPRRPTSPQGRQVARRDVLFGMAGNVGAVPALAQAGATETPVLRVFRQWRARFIRLSAEAEYLTDDEFDRGLAEVTVIEERLLAIDSQTEMDGLVKVVARTSGGVAVAPDGDPRNTIILAEAHQFVDRH